MVNITWFPSIAAHCIRKSCTRLLISHKILTGATVNMLHQNISLSSRMDWQSSQILFNNTLNYSVGQIFSKWVLGMQPHYNWNVNTSPFLIYASGFERQFVYAIVLELELELINSTFVIDDESQILFAYKLRFNT